MAIRALQSLIGVPHCFQKKNVHKATVATRSHSAGRWHMADSVRIAA